jgi:hypothetical protein
LFLDISCCLAEVTGFTMTVHMHKLFSSIKTLVLKWNHWAKLLLSSALMHYSNKRVHWQRTQLMKDMFISIVWNYEVSLHRCSKFYFSFMSLYCLLIYWCAVKFQWDAYNPSIKYLNFNVCFILDGSIDPSLTSEEREQKRQQATDRATFVQGLVLSTLFGDWIIEGS